ncbi:unnamed protein product [Closterium sp. NIES-54]
MRSAFKRYKLLKLAMGEEKMAEEGGARDRWIEKSAVLYDLILQSVNNDMFQHINDLVELDDSGPKAWKLLHDVIQPNTLPMVIVLEKELAALSMRPGDDVKPVLDKIKDTYVRMAAAGSNVSHMQQCTKIISVLDNSWDNLIPTLNTQQDQWTPEWLRQQILQEDFRRRHTGGGAANKTAEGYGATGGSRGRGGGRGRGRGRGFGKGRGRGDYNEGHGSSGPLLPMIGVGNAKVMGADGGLVGLGNLLLVEGLSANLLSVRRLQKSKAKVTFGPTSCCAKLGKLLLWDLEEKSTCIKDLWQLPIIPWNGKPPATAAAAATAKATTGGEETAPTDGALDAVKKVQQTQHPHGEVLAGVDATAAWAKASSRSGEADWETWHERLCHVNFPMLQKLVKDGSLKGLEVKGAVKEVGSCPTCLETKFTKFPFSSGTGPAKAPLALVHMDVVGPTRAPSLSSSRYFLTIVDNHTRAVWVYPLKTKGEVATGVLKEWMPRAQRESGHKVNVGEFIGADFEAVLKKKGIQHQLTVPYNPQQNGVAERFNWTLQEGARTLLGRARLPDPFWVTALRQVALVKNRVLATVGDKQWVPYTKWYGSAPAVNMLRAYGCMVVFHGWLIWDLTSQQLTVSRDVKFLESLYYKEWKQQQQKLPTTPLIIEADEVQRPLRQVQVAVSDEEISGVTEDGGEPEVEEQQQQQQQDTPQGAARPADRPRRDVRPPNRLTYPSFGKPKVARARSVAEQCDEDKIAHCYWVGVPESKTLAEALSGPDAEKWKQSVKEEYESLLENETWELCELPPGKKAISSKLIFRHEYGPDGELTRYKSRLVAKGFQQTKGKDFDEIFTPVGKGTTLRVMLGTAAKRGWRIKQMDITTSFLNGIILEELYMLQPEGLDDGSGRVFRLKKAIYGLKQAPRAWYHKLEETLLAGGFKKSECDHSLFLLQEKEQFLMLLVYVDDILLFSESSAMIEHVEEMLEMQFKCSKMGDVKYYLGMHVERDLDKGTLHRGAADLSKGEMLLTCYTDASFNSVKADGTSIGGYVFLFGGGAVSWRSKLQNESVGAASAPSGSCRTGRSKGGRCACLGGGGGGGGGGGSGGGGGGGGSGGGGGGVGSSSGGGGGGGGSGGGGGGGGGRGSGGAGCGVAQRSSSGGGQRQQQQRSRETPSPQQLSEWYAGRQRGGGAGPCTYIPRWGDLSRAGVAVFDLDYDAILAAMYALSTSDEGDCYLCVPRDPGIAAAALGAGETAALGASVSATPGAGESASSGTTSAQVFHTFTLDSGASRSFFRDRTTLTPLSRLVAVSLADPSGGLVLASFSTVLPCPAAPSDSLSGLYLPSFSTNLVSGADLQDQGVDQFTPAGQRVTHCTCARTGRHLATFTRQPGSSLYTLSTASPPVPASGQVAASSQVFAAASGSGPESVPCSCRLLSHQTLLWHHRLGHPSVPRLRGMASRVLVSGLPRSLPPLPPGPAPTCVPCVEGRQRAAPHSSKFPPTEAPLQTLHMDVWGPARVRGQGHERYFLLVVDDYSRYTTVFPLRSKGEVTKVLIDWIRAARLRLRESFGSGFPVLRLHSNRGGEFSSARLGAFCRAQGIRQTFTLPASPQKNGIAERRIGMVMDVALTSMIHAAAPHFLWPFAVQYAAHQLNLQPRVSLPETSPTLLWTGKVGDASAFRSQRESPFVMPVLCSTSSLVTESASASVCPPSVGGECALGTDVLEDRQEEFQCLAAASPRLVSVLLTPEGDPDALDIPTPRSYAEAIEGTYVDAVPPSGANIVSGMWIFRVKRPPGSPPVFKARYVAHGFSQRQGVDYFQTFSPTPKMTTLRVLLHVAAHRDYELHSLDFSTAFLQGSLHEEIWLRRPPGFTGSFPPGTQWSLRRPVYGLRQAPREWHDTLRTTLAALGFAPSTADPSQFLRTDTSLPPFYILVYVDDLVFATANTAGLAYVKSELQKRHTCTDLGELRSYLGLQITRDRAQCTITLTQSHMVQQVLQRFSFTYSSPQATPLPTRHSLSALPSDESVESSGPYPELVGCLMYLMTCTRPDLAYPLSILARYVAPGRHRPEHMAAAKRVLRYLCNTSGMGLVLGGRSPVFLTGHADASWANDQATQRSSQGYTFSLVLYVDNKAMLALCREQRLEHRTKHIALRYFLARELQQRGQLRLAYVASEANTADVFTKALAPCDHQRFCTQLGLVPVLPHLLTS